MAPSEAQTDRKAALLLHSLAPADQARVLQRLDTSAREHLQALLAELAALGIPKGRQWVPVDEAESSQPASPADARQPLRHARADAVRDALAGQCVDTVATVLLCERWPWAGAVVDGWPADQRAKLRALVQDARQEGREVPPALADHLLGRLAEQVRSQAPGGSVPSRRQRPGPWYARLWSSIAS